MTNKRIIWLTFFLALCLFGGGLYHSVSVEEFPCELTSRDEGIRNWLHFVLKRRFLISKIKRHAEIACIDLAKCDRVCVAYKEQQGWVCNIFPIEGRDSRSWSWSWQLELDQDGEFRWLSNIKKNEAELKKLLAEEKELQDLLHDYCDYLVWPRIH